MKTLIYLLLLTALNIDCFTQEYLAVLKKGIESAEIQMYNNKVGEINYNDTFLVYKEKGYYGTPVRIWKKNGEQGYIDTSKIHLLSSSFFKIKYYKEEIIAASCTKHVEDNFNLINIDYCTLVKKVINEKDYNALKKFFCLNKKTKAALSEIHDDTSWQIINYYSDKEFYSFLRSLDDEEKGEIANHLMNPMVTYPIINNIEKYYKKYYPLTWSIIKKYYKKL